MYLSTLILKFPPRFFQMLLKSGVLCRDFDRLAFPFKLLIYFTYYYPQFLLYNIRSVIQSYTSESVYNLLCSNSLYKIFRTDRSTRKFPNHSPECYSGVLLGTTVIHYKGTIVRKSIFPRLLWQLSLVLGILQVLWAWVRHDTTW